MAAGIKGFRFGGLASGIKKTGRPDLGVIVADAPVPAAAVFTRSHAAAAPVHLSRRHLKSGRIRAVVVNSGNANACTGVQGEADALEMTALTADALETVPEEILVASTGVIGAPLPMDRLRAGIPLAVDAARTGGADDFARAILTTDKGPKVARAKVATDGGRVNALGFAKGAGMIMPNMATMLGFICTDAKVTARDLRRVTRRVVDETFNAITVDGDTSTNDAVFVLASGESGVSLDEETLAHLLHRVMAPLAHAIVADGEGATHVVDLTVSGARSRAEADKVARRVANSPLVKTAIHGMDPNWGRIVGAAASAGVTVDPNRFDLTIGRIAILRAGKWRGPDAEQRARKVMARPSFPVVLDLGQGEASRTLKMSDLSAEYVAINAGYRS